MSDPYGQQPYGQQPYGQQPYGQPQQFGATYAEASQATMILVLGILGLILCSICAPIAWVMGNKEIAAIDAGRRDPGQRGTANAGRIMGIIGTALMVLGLLFLIFFFVVAIGASASAGA